MLTQPHPDNMAGNNICSSVTSHTYEAEEPPELKGHYTHGRNLNISPDFFFKKLKTKIGFMAWQTNTITIPN